MAAMTPDEFSIYLDKAAALSQEQLSKVIKNMALDIEKDAKTACPVDTGNLRASITSTIGEDEATVGTNVEYAPYVEFGTWKMKAQPFLIPAAQSVSEHVEDYLKEVKIF